MPIWRREHDAVDRLLAGSDPDRLRADLTALTGADAAPPRAIEPSARRAVTRG
jgi:hypothetical protein